MDSLITLVVFVVGGYLGWKILLAAWGGLSRFGDSLERNLPAFFEKVFFSLASGVVAGGITHIVFGASDKVTTAGALGGTLLGFVVSTMKNGGGSDMG